MEKDVFIFGANLSLFAHIDTKNQNVLNLRKGPTQGLDDTILTDKAMDLINFTQPNKRFVLSLQFNASSSFLFVNATKIYQFKAKDSEIKDYAPFLGNISKDFTNKNTKNKQD